MNLFPLSFGQRQTEKILKEDALRNILQNIIKKKKYTAHSLLMYLSSIFIQSV